jgi:hypothetical protein
VQVLIARRHRLEAMNCHLGIAFPPKS